MFFKNAIGRMRNKGRTRKHSSTRKNQYKKYDY
jgi:hypothetical protein